MSMKRIFSALAFISLAVSIQSSPIEDTLQQEVASALGVTVDQITALQAATNLSLIDAELWANQPSSPPVNVTAWDDDIKVHFLEGIKSAIDQALNTTTLSKRTLGSDSAPARAQVDAAIAQAEASRDSSNRRRLLQCNSGSQTSCTICAGLCSLAWGSASALCGGAALGAEAASGGGLTPAVALTLGGCLGIATSVYGACIVKCVG